ncbi:PspC domain-containing protein [Ammonicoccus fulvus]|uniref:PspC domain-containing protein n=1 Tax=Ammonicoccus fulvus TaxID=3138240 RepID=A0ABZ3FUJ9_9ACTN
MELTQLRRSTTDGRVAGVCVMLADRWRVDPMLIRVAALLLALSSGIGLVLYAAAWLAIPAQGSDRAPIDSILPGVRRLSRGWWIAGLVIACIAAASALASVLPFGIGPAAVMGAVWYFGWYRPSRQQAVTSSTTPPTPPALAGRPFAEPTAFTEAAAAWQQRVQAYLDAKGAPTSPPEASPASDPGYSLDAFLAMPDPVGLYAEDEAAEAAAAPPTPPPAAPVTAPAAPVPTRTKRRTARMHLIGWSLVFIAVGVVAAIDTTREVSILAYPAAVLLALGLAHIIGAWLPRPRGLFVVAILLTLVTGVVAAPAPQTNDSTVRYASVAHLPVAPVEHGSGRLVADLSQLPLNSDTDYTVSVDAGNLVVIVPPEANVSVIWSVGVGDAQILGAHSEDGIDLGANTLSRGSDPNGPTLTIHARVSVGQLVVTR